MNERYRLNSELVRSSLEREQRKRTWLCQKLGVSGSLVDRMLYEGHVPKLRTLAKLAAALGVPEEQLLLPREDRASA